MARPASGEEVLRISALVDAAVSDAREAAAATERREESALPLAHRFANACRAIATALAEHHVIRHTWLAQATRFEAARALADLEGLTRAYADDVETQLAAQTYYQLSTGHETSEEAQAAVRAVLRGTTKNRN